MLSDEQISTLTNHFVRMILRIGPQSICGADRQICLLSQSDGWSIELMHSSEKRLSKATTCIEYPRALPEEELDAAIELAGLVSSWLHEWEKRSEIGQAAGKASSASLTPAQRSERAKKAVQARIAKYGQKTRI